MQVTFKTQKQTTFKLDCNENDTVASVKKKIEEEKGEEFAAPSQKLTRSGKIMEDEKMLKDYKVSEKGFIAVMVTSKSKAATAEPPTATPAKAPEASPEEKPESTDISTPESAEPKEEKTKPEGNMPDAPDPADAGEEVGLTMKQGESEAENRSATAPTPQPTAQPASDGADHFEQLIRQPQFQPMRQVLQQNPELKAQLMKQLNHTNPNFHQMIRNNPK